MKNLHILTQDVITKTHSCDFSGPGRRHSRIDTQDWKNTILQIENDPDLADERPAVFCSLAIASFINRSCPSLARGLVLPRQFLDHHHYTALIPRDLHLNAGGIYLPWGRIALEPVMLRTLFPKGVFIRPDSPMKPFTGFSSTHDDLAYEIHAMGRAAMIDPFEMCYICQAQNIPEVEYRCWIVDGAVATSASYGWQQDSETFGPAPDSILNAALRVARAVEMSEQVFTADFVLMDDSPKLVELNATSTSGWYASMTPEHLISAMDPVFV
jgi:hypothetical protein